MDFHLLTPEFGWVLESRGLYTTNNGGTSFTDATPSQVGSGTFLAADFLNPEFGWFAVQSGAETVAVYQTSNAGSTWRELTTISVDRAVPITGASISIASTNHEGVLVDDGDMTIPAAYFATTANGGATWSGGQIAYPGQLALLGSGVDVVQVQDGTNLLAESLDNGKTWTAVNDPPIPSGYQGDYATAVIGSLSASGKFAATLSKIGGPGNLDATVIYRVAPSNGALSVVGVLGANTSSAATPAASFQYSHAAVLILPPGVTQSGHSELLTSSNGGSTFSTSQAITPPIATGLTAAQAMAGGAQSISVVRASFPDASHGWVLFADAVCTGFKTGCSNGQLLASTSNGGATFTPVGLG
ncbi:MAG: hypothetical protein M0000_11960 [Actinomycetota bacterium]|nr:hypothetical protein [Actinomycetota bacterium]